MKRTEPTNNEAYAAFGRAVAALYILTDEEREDAKPLSGGDFIQEVGIASSDYIGHIMPGAVAEEPPTPEEIEDYEERSIDSEPFYDRTYSIWTEYRGRHQEPTVHIRNTRRGYQDEPAPGEKIEIPLSAFDFLVKR